MSVHEHNVHEESKIGGFYSLKLRETNRLFEIVSKATSAQKQPSKKNDTVPCVRVRLCENERL